MRMSTFVLVLIAAAAVLPAAEGNFQVNSVFQHTSYPMFGSGGKDVIRVTSAGIGLKSTSGKGVHGVIDLDVLLPYKVQERIYPSDTFTDRVLTGFPVGLDVLVGIGYFFDLEPMGFLVSAGFHTGAFFEGGDSLASFGIGIDGQVLVHFTEVVTAQIGLKTAMDFGGFQTFTSGSGEFAGFPFTLGFYTGFGLNY